MITDSNYCCLPSDPTFIIVMAIANNECSLNNSTLFGNDDNIFTLFGYTGPDVSVRPKPENLLVGQSLMGLLVLGTV